MDDALTERARGPVGLNRVAHRAVARVTDDDVERDGSTYLVMELLSGSMVDGRVQTQGGRLDLDLTLGIADATLDVLGAAHERL